jgi:predicted nucleic acid-binding protein
VLIDSERRALPLDAAAGDDARAISVITASELLHGVHRAVDDRIRAQRRAFVEHVLARFEPIPITTQIARTHSEIWAHLERTGNSIGAHDLWIAATALAGGFRVATTNHRHFQRVPGLSVLAL